MFFQITPGLHDVAFLDFNFKIVKFDIKGKVTSLGLSAMV